MIKQHSTSLQSTQKNDLAYRLRLVCLPALLFMSSTAFAECRVDPSSNTSNTSNVRGLPLLFLENMDYAGAFTVPDGNYGNSSMNYSLPVIEISGDSLFAVGHVYEDAIAEFTVPALVNSTQISELNSTGAPRQVFSSVLNRAAGGNTQSIDQINGLELYEGQLIVNGVEFYDAAADNSNTSIVISDASNIANSTVKGYFRLRGAARAAGWMSQLPPEWQAELGKTHMVGNSSGRQSIDSRNSMGPSAYAVDASEIVNASQANSNIDGTKLLEFDLTNPLNDDLYNDSRTNDLWTVTAKAAYGFVVPGTRTYATFGSITGIESGLGYKITQDNGTACGGPCSYQASDEYNYYWFWDMNDLLDVRAGNKASYELRPYAYGEMSVPFQPGNSINEIGGGTYDAASNTLYLSIKDANNTLGPYSNPPIIAAYRFNGF